MSIQEYCTEKHGEVLSDLFLIFWVDGKTAKLRATVSHRFSFFTCFLFDLSPDSMRFICSRREVLSLNFFFG
jgi:hypothetical protein